MGFFLDEDVLYKKGKDHILLRCVDALILIRPRKSYLRFTNVSVVYMPAGT